MTNTYTGKQTSSKTAGGAAPCGCGCGGGHGTTTSTDCCGLNCFERPRYFCGHLLTDDDLSLEQRYVLEKNRLRNRELHGKGVVCGLRISCDPDCCGHVLIGGGYAIDDCGNDLVVCAPYSFNAIGALPKPGVVKDDCDDDETGTDDCPTPNCYYLAACYYEEESDYTTPFVAGCNGTPGACEPTRVHEKVRFKLLDELPPKHSYLDDIETRMRECWSPFTKGRFVEVINGYYNQVQNSDGNTTGNYDRFCQLRALFLQQLQKRPSMQDCSLERDVRALECPTDAQRDPAAERIAFEKLLTFIHQYVWDCMLGQLAFECKSPCQPCCVILGSVEIESGKIVRVCNCEREYVWSFANFLEVLLFTTLQGGACNHNTLSTSAKKQCCPSFTVDTAQFGTLYELDPRVREYSGQTFVTALRALTASFQQSYQFTQQGVMAPKLFEGEMVSRVRELASKMGLTAVQELKGTAPENDFVSTLRANTLIQQGDSLLAFTDAKGTISSVMGFKGTSSTTGALEQTNTQDLQKEMEALKASHADLAAKLAEMQTAMKAAPAPPPPPQPEGGNPDAPHGGG